MDDLQTLLLVAVYEAVDGASRAAASSRIESGRIMCVSLMGAAIAACGAHSGVQKPTDTPVTKHQSGSTW
jgi:hypothetical protein